MTILRLLLTSYFNFSIVDIDELCYFEEHLIGSLTTWILLLNSF